MSKVIQKVFKSNLSENLLNAQYAVRGKALLLANALKDQLKDPNNKLPFEKIIHCNIGNPQALKQIPITFPRHVMSLVSSPDMMENKEYLAFFKEDEIARAKEILENMTNTGAYSHSKGHEFIRKKVVEFIAKRDGCRWEMENPHENIFLTDGASPGVSMMISALTRNKCDAHLVPIPQYPLYTATIALNGGSVVGYYLDEEKGWGLGIEELERALHKAKYEDGLNVRSLTVINPGNPTGQLIEKENMKDIIQFCVDNEIVLIADEVYQENIYVKGKEWNSFRKVANEMGKEVFTKLEFASLHSVSKGFFGECGRRGGYIEFSQGWDKEVLNEFYKKASINLCPNVDGQIMTSLMVDPPKKGDPSFELYNKEKTDILQSLERRAKKLVKTLSELEGVTCNESEAAMYCFPNVRLPSGAIEAAKSYVDPVTGKKESVVPDMFYCLELLKETGICVVPGSGFLQRDGTYHFRTTFLPQEEDMDTVGDLMKKFHSGFMKKYA